MFNECLRLRVPSTSHRVAFGRAVLSMHSTPTSIDCGFGLVQWLIFAQRVNPLSPQAVVVLPVCWRQANFL